jgi:hypothetical protein
VSVGARRSLLILTGVLVAGAMMLASREALDLPEFLAGWSRRHPDPRGFAVEEVLALEALRARERRDDLLWLFGGLAAGCLAVAVRPSLVRAAGGTTLAVCAAGSVALGAWALADSVAAQWSMARQGRWTLGDDGLGLIAGEHADTLAAWRRRIGPDDAVILIGTNQQLWTAAAWALHPRAIYPLVQAVPEGVSELTLLAVVRRLPLGQQHPVRWALDVDALAAGASATRPALLRVDP